QGVVIGSTCTVADSEFTERPVERIPLGGQHDARILVQLDRLANCSMQAREINQRLGLPACFRRGGRYSDLSTPCALLVLQSFEHIGSSLIGPVLPRLEQSTGSEH